jgi:hypothetical protein
VGKFYGEQVFDFLQTSKTVSVNGGGPTPSTAAGTHRVTSSDPLRLRSDANKDDNNPNSNVIAKLPKGQIVRAITNQPINGFLEIETDLNGEHLRGFCVSPVFAASLKVLQMAAFKRPPVITTAAQTGGTLLQVFHCNFAFSLRQCIDGKAGDVSVIIKTS